MSARLTLRLSLEGAANGGARDSESRAPAQVVVDCEALEKTLKRISGVSLSRVEPRTRQRVDSRSSHEG